MGSLFWSIPIVKWHCPYTLSISAMNFQQWSYHLHKSQLCFLKYSDLLSVERKRGRSSSPGRGKNCLFSTFFRPVLGFSLSLTQLVPRALYPWRSGQGVKLTAHFQQCWEQDYMDIYIHPPPIAPPWRTRCLVKHADNCVLSPIQVLSYLRDFRWSICKLLTAPHCAFHALNIASSLHFSGLI